ncbi:hypothetical protein QMZ05_24520 [Bradyrhizobium sp. INPA03-11B]|uniref:hypothetical protein n=1 Tax=Bradyrhizobium sp. INPA03-11B TaxID=418598 RepID=UPI00339044A4
MAAKPTEVVAVKVRIREKTRRLLEAAANKEGHGSVNREIERRLERSFMDEAMSAVIDITAAKTAREFSSAIRDLVTDLMSDKAGEFDKIAQAIERIDRTLKLHEVILTKGNENGTKAK